MSDVPRWPVAERMQEPDEPLSVEPSAIDAHNAGVGQADTSDVVDEVTALLEADSETTSSSAVMAWTRVETRSAEDYLELADWVDMMASVHAVTELPACWLAHEGWVCELAALRAAWLEANTLAAEQGMVSSAMLSWYQYSWWPWRHRVSEYRGCGTVHSRDVVGVATDRTLLPGTAGIGRRGGRS